MKNLKSITKNKKDFAWTPELAVIRNTINKYDTANVLTDEIKDLMTASLIAFVRISIVKFIQGQIEHGGDIRDINLNTALEEENIDTFWYLSANKWKLMRDENKNQNSNKGKKRKKLNIH